SNDFTTAFFVNAPGQVLTIALECGNDVELLAVTVACLNRSAVNHKRRSIQAAHCDQAARHILVATGKRDVGVVPLTTHHRLDGIGDEITRLKREAHAVGPHRYAVTHTNGVES